MSETDYQYFLLMFMNLIISNACVMASLSFKAYREVLEKLNGDSNFIENYLGFDLIKCPLNDLFPKVKMYIKGKKDYRGLYRKIIFYNFSEITFAVQGNLLIYYIFYRRHFLIKGGDIMMDMIIDICVIMFVPIAILLGYFYFNVYRVVVERLSGNIEFEEYLGFKVQQVPREFLLHKTIEFSKNNKIDGKALNFIKFNKFFKGTFLVMNIFMIFFYSVYSLQFEQMQYMKSCTKCLNKIQQNEKVNELKGNNTNCISQ